MGALQEPLNGLDGALPLFEVGGRADTTGNFEPVQGNPSLEGVPQTFSEAPASLGSLVSDEVFHASDRDEIWSRGDTYKSHADGSGFTYVPFLGSSAPRNFPVRFELKSVNAGESIAFQEQGSVMRTADRIQIDRGSVQVWYYFSTDSVEQSFAFSEAAMVSIGAAGSDLELVLSVESDLPMVDLQGGVGFEGRLGGVHYQHALAFDGAGNELALPIHATDG